MGHDDFLSWRHIPGTKEKPGFSLFCKAVQKPDLDDREYRMIRLQNGILALLINDSRTDKAAATLAISVGHLQDPVREPPSAALHFRANV